MLDKRKWRGKTSRDINISKDARIRLCARFGSEASRKTHFQNESSKRKPTNRHHLPSPRSLAQRLDLSASGAPGYLVLDAEAEAASLAPGRSGRPRAKLEWLGTRVLGTKRERRCAASSGCRGTKGEGSSRCRGAGSCGGRGTRVGVARSKRESGASGRGRRRWRTEPTGSWCATEPKATSRRGRSVVGRRRGAKTRARPKAAV